MNRCANHPFDYCDTDPELDTHTKDVTLKGLGGKNETTTLIIVTCPQDWRTCEHRRTQSQLETNNRIGIASDNAQ